MKTIKDILLYEGVSVNSGDSISTTIAVMYKNKHGVVVVLSNDLPIGIITERDILHTMDESYDASLPIESILESYHLITVNGERSIEYSLHILIDNNIRRLIVINDTGEFLGVVTQDILIQYLEDDSFKTNILVSSFIQKDRELISLNKSQTLSQALHTMNDNNIGSIIATDDENNPVGIITERDVVFIAKNRVDLSTKISEIMSSPIISVKSSQNVKDVIELMKSKKIRRVLVTDSDEKIVSILDIRDIAQNLKGNYGKLLESKLKNIKNTLNYIGEAILEINEDNGVQVIQWMNDKAIKNFGRMTDKNLMLLINQNIWQEIYNLVKLNGQCEKYKIELNGMYFEMMCSYHFTNNKETLLMILRDISKYEYAVINADKKSSELHKELNILQGVIDQQNSIVLVSDGKNIMSANKSFFNFYRLNTIEEFTNKYGSVCDTFIKHKDFFYTSSSEKKWVEEILKLDQKQRVVSIFDIYISEPRVFTIQISQLNTDEKNYAITFTDITDIKLESQQYYHDATHDILTKIYNRAYYLDKITSQVEQYKRHGIAFCIILIDIDHFKVFNDKYGHIKGDEILIALSSTISKSARKADTFARWGGEEFIILLENTTIKKAELISENFRKLIENIKLDDIEKITASFGVAQFGDKDDENSILKRADKALYEAKESGRNIVVSK